MLISTHFPGSGQGLQSRRPRGLPAAAAGRDPLRGGQVVQGAWRCRSRRRGHVRRRQAADLPAGGGRSARAAAGRGAAALPGSHLRAADGQPLLAALRRTVQRPAQGGRGLWPGGVGGVLENGGKDKSQKLNLQCDEKVRDIFMLEADWTMSLMLMLIQTQFNNKIQKI